MSNKELFFISMAALGGYSAWLSIKSEQSTQAQSDWLTRGAFSEGGYDFYGVGQPKTYDLDKLTGVTRGIYDFFGAYS